MERNFVSKGGIIVVGDAEYSQVCSGICSWNSLSSLSPLIARFFFFLFVCLFFFDYTFLSPQNTVWEYYILTMASRPITSRQIDGEKMETVTNFIFLGSRITVDHNCSHEIKRCLLLGRKPRQCISREIALLTKVRLVKAMVFPGVMYGCESWTIRKAECQRIDAF